MRLFVALDLPWELRQRLAMLSGAGIPGARWVPPENYHVTLRFIGETPGYLAEDIDQALAARHIPVLLSGMEAPPNLGPDYARSFRAVFDSLGKRPGVLYDPFFLQGVAEDPALNQSDGLHPNPEGVKRIVARLLPLVEKLLAEVPPA